jgi:hypothetical protein
MKHTLLATSILGGVSISSALGYCNLTLGFIAGLFGAGAAVIHFMLKWHKWKNKDNKD